MNTYIVEIKTVSRAYSTWDGIDDMPQSRHPILIKAKSIDDAIIKLKKSRYYNDYFINYGNLSEVAESKLSENKAIVSDQYCERWQHPDRNEDSEGNEIELKDSCVIFTISLAITIIK